MSAKHKVLVVGGGFGGVKAAQELAKDYSLQVTLLSDGSELRYYPTLYHTATGGSRVNSSIPYTTIFAGYNIKIVKGLAVKLDRQKQEIITDDNQSHKYDTLVLALGVVTNYFGIEGMDKYSYSIKSQAEAARFKKHIHDQLSATHRPDPNYIVIGAGPTGIELAGTLPEYVKHVMKRHGLPSRKVHVDLVEAAPRILPSFTPKVSRTVQRRLKKLGVKTYTDSTVTGLDANNLMIKNKPIRSHTVVWTAGVANNPFFKDNDFVIANHGKVAVNTFLQTEDNIFVIGDNANTPYSGLAQTALLDGEFVAHNIKRKVRGKRLKSYVARMPVSVIPAGKHWAVIVWGGLVISGWFGWLLREAADFVGFKHLETWPKASKQFLSEFTQDNDCIACNRQQENNLYW